MMERGLFALSFVWGDCMSDLYLRIDELLKKKGVSGARMSQELGMSRSFMTELRKGRARGVTAETARKLADYFGVTVEYLLGSEAPSPIAFTRREQRDIARDLEAFIADMDSGGLMFDGDPMSDEAKDSIIQAVRMGLELAKVKNKERFDPTKNKKD
ncbi:MAG: helix-turn-helix transcriptional regulator [Ruminococcaceae bacterium]|nr:helix-turn-helix transcriptional regulator [Oscillospiraceae bacterium]